jgi:hypothetical protein
MQVLLDTNILLDVLLNLKIISKSLPPWRPG